MIALIQIAAFQNCAKMSAKAINEVTGKGLLNNYIEGNLTIHSRFASVNEETNWDTLVQDNPWLQTEVIIIFLLSANNNMSLGS